MNNHRIAWAMELAKILNILGAELLGLHLRGRHEMMIVEHRTVTHSPLFGLSKSVDDLDCIQASEGYRWWQFATKHFGGITRWHAKPQAAARMVSAAKQYIGGAAFVGPPRA